MLAQHESKIGNSDYCPVKLELLKLKFEHACALYTVAMFEARVARLAGDENAYLSMPEDEKAKLDALDDASIEARDAYIDQGVRMRKNSEWESQVMYIHSQM